MATASSNPALLQTISSAAPAAAERTAPAAGGPDSGRFGGVLRTTQAAGVSFSNHAMQRVQRRGIDVSPQTLHRLSEGVARAAGKGARDSVVFVSGTAFVVSVANRTVITAVDQGHMRDFVFTNIDSAVIA